MIYNNEINAKKKKKHFNIADIVIILVILAIVGYIAYGIITSYASDLFETEYDVEYTVKISEIMKCFEGNIKVGDIITETETLSEIGTVISVKTTPCIFTAVDRNGRSVTGDNPLYIDVVITVKAKASLPDGIFTVNGYRITAGKDISLRFPDFIGKGKCTGIAEVE